MSLSLESLGPFQTWKGLVHVTHRSTYNIGTVLSTDAQGLARDSAEVTLGAFQAVLVMMP